jgi:hypothetical protein
MLKVRPMGFFGSRWPLVVGAVLLLAACAGGTGAGGSSDTATASASQNAQFTGVALPPGYSLDGGRSLALGVGDRWIGRIVFTSGMSTSDMFDFYLREMPKFGWVEGAVVRAETSLLTFTSSATARIAVVQITGRTLGGSSVEMVVSPQTDAAAGASSSMPAPASRPAPVSTQPLQ